MLHLLEHFVHIMFIVSILLCLKIIQNTLSRNDVEAHYQTEPHRNITNSWKVMYASIHSPAHYVLSAGIMLRLIECVLCQQLS